jgi:hypothetical protein
LAVACPYKGFRYAAPCRAQAGEPCRDAKGHAADYFHAERRAAAGEHVPTYEERFGGDPAPVEEEPPEEEPAGDEEEAAAEEP